MRISRRVQSIPPSGIRRFFDLVSQMDDVISLGVGEPDFVTPWHIREAAIYALERGQTHYTANAGLLELRELIARYLDRRFGLEYSPAGEVLVTVGVSEGLDLALRSILDPGDEVLVPQPCYVSYVPCVRFAGAEPVIVATHREEAFRPTAAALEAAVTERTRALLICYPNNPTGSTLDPREMAAIADLAVRRDLIVISDEIYAELTYDRQHRSLASFPGMADRTIVLNGFSKAYAMTGWRLAYAAGPSDLIGAMTKVHQYTMLCAPISSQRAAIEALKAGEPDVQAMVREYDGRRRLFTSGLQDLGLMTELPEGAFYAFPDVRSTGLTDEEFADALLREERVAVVPGSAFGESGAGHVRCSYASSVDQLQEALVRLQRFVSSRVSVEAHSA